MGKVICLEKCHINRIFLSNEDEDGNMLDRPPNKMFNHDPRGTGKTYRKNQIVDESEILVPDDKGELAIPGRHTKPNRRTGEVKYRPYFMRLSELVGDQPGGGLVVEIKEYQEILGYSDKDIDGLVLSQGLERRTQLLDYLKTEVAALVKKSQK